ncbi:MAG: helix-turn-helix domain-containing protein [Proteobacteria bacterium]|nr:helix-turn-helix domain-containing protein [Pseudomonadota bacterium]
MQTITLLLTGFSIIYLVVFVLTHFINEYYDQQQIARVFGIVLMLCLAALQGFHYQYFVVQMDQILTPMYLIVLYLIAPSFYFYARSVLKAQDRFNLIHVLHFAPLGLVFLLGHQWAFTLAFVIGSGYLLWLLKTIYALRTHKAQFKNELILLIMVFIIAIGVSVVALTMPIELKLFYNLYASAIGLALFIVALVVSYKPKITQEVKKIAQQTYTISTLAAIDTNAKISDLNDLMHKHKLYQQSNLDLQTIATELDLTSHQLSELINSKLDMGFSRFLREQRVNASKIILIEQPNASVLSVGLDVGFSSQSNFYEAFKEIAQTTPGKYRKNSSEPGL